MKTVKGWIMVLTLTGTCLYATAQDAAPKGFTKGTITLTDGTVQTGYVKNNMRSNATIVFAGEAGKKKTYDGTGLSAVTIDGVEFHAVQGDFFKIISTGNIMLLQKSSQASGQMADNGGEAYVRSGAPGNINDYFLFKKQTDQLILTTAKNWNASLTAISSCAETAAIISRFPSGYSQLKEIVAALNAQCK
jgi:hypothetical protein